MNIKEALKNYTKDKIALEGLKTELSDMPRYTTTSDKIATSMNEYPYLYKTTNTQGQVERHQWRELNENIKAKEQELKKVDEFVGGIDDYIVRRAVKLFYCEGRSWQQVANSFDNCLSWESIRKKVVRFLEKF